jgi:chaperonin GroEL (HSP60 family)
MTQGEIHAPQVVESSDTKVGFNAATGAYEDMFAAGIIDPAKVRPCRARRCLRSALYAADGSAILIDCFPDNCLSLCTQLYQ